ncbi:uncharacterized protein LOC132707417 isoform X2 [Cylas formicarius]|nr:uncharacterized protein LOC132707417 isoform X2 [Cylas formicarius]XP_060535268.1 uncharacterized protein LOC132707417 isoform X2 [Cylas formicarius]XP_060535276.1 uncharacterized protein LOC132707417 isoform X2 [Cylas formicarius]
MCCRFAIVWKHSDPTAIALFKSICWSSDSVDLKTQQNIRKDANYVDNLFKMQLVSAFLCTVIFHVDFVRLREMSISIFYVSQYFPHLETAVIFAEITLWIYGSLGMIQCPFMLFYYIIHTVYQLEMFNAYITKTRSVGYKFSAESAAFQKLQRKRLIDLIDRQQEIKRMTVLYLNIFSNSAFFYTVVAMLTSLAVLFYIFYDDSEHYRAHMLLLISLYTTVMFVVMKYGQRYEDEFENVFLNLSSEPWYDWNTLNRKIYMTMLMKSQKPETVRMGKLADLNCVFGKNIFQGIFTVANMFNSLQN